MKIYLIRHGKTKGNLERRYIGSTDEPLCPQGIEELLQKRTLKIYPASPEKLAVSPMLRCRQTAQLLFPGVEQAVIPDFRETDFGRFENKNYLELSHDPAYQRWLDSNGTLPFPEGENHEAFCKRCAAAFQSLSEQWQKDNVRTAAIVAHGGTIMAILSHRIPSDFYDWQVKNGDCICLTMDGDTIRAEKLQK